MPDTRTDLASLALDALGRVVLSDDLLITIEEYEGTVSAGGNNSNCSGPGPVNWGCINGYCDHQTNEACTNLASCDLATNYANCKQPNQVPGG